MFPLILHCSFTVSCFKIASELRQDSHLLWHQLVNFKTAKDDTSWQRLTAAARADVKLSYVLRRWWKLVTGHPLCAANPQLPYLFHLAKGLAQVLCPKAPYDDPSHTLALHTNLPLPLQQGATGIDLRLCSAGTSYSGCTLSEPAAAAAAAGGGRGRQWQAGDRESGGG